MTNPPAYYDRELNTAPKSCKLHGSLVQHLGANPINLFEVDLLTRFGKIDHFIVLVNISPNNEIVYITIKIELLNILIIFIVTGPWAQFYKTFTAIF